MFVFNWAWENCETLTNIKEKNCLEIRPEVTNVLRNSHRDKLGRKGLFEEMFMLRNLIKLSLFRNSNNDCIISFEEMPWISFQSSSLHYPEFLANYQTKPFHTATNLSGEKPKLICTLFSPWILDDDYLGCWTFQTQCHLSINVFPSVYTPQKKIKMSQMNQQRYHLKLPKYIYKAKLLRLAKFIHWFIPS